MDDVPEEDRREELIREMEHRFLSGKDTEYVDYAKIDADVSLDIQKETDDAEERYFSDED
ncbi:MAG: coiled-coil domain-containing protein [Proteobacteria bacterium]|nr:coiled-coil domain-containing protein [Pseudomonadota bacterium]